MISQPKLELKSEHLFRQKLHSSIENHMIGRHIHQIDDRIHEHGDIWVCKTCNQRGDKW